MSWTVQYRVNGNWLSATSQKFKTKRLANEWAEKSNQCMRNGYQSVKVK